MKHQVWNLEGYRLAHLEDHVPDDAGEDSLWRVDGQWYQALGPVDSDNVVYVDSINPEVPDDLSPQQMAFVLKALEKAPYLWEDIIDSLDFFLDKVGTNGGAR